MNQEQTHLSMATSNIQALLFDFGGVLVEIDFNCAFAHWQPISRLSATTGD